MFEEEIRAREGTIHRAEVVIQASQNILEYLEDIRAEIERLEEMKGQLNQRVEKADAERMQVEQAMVEKNSQFRLLLDYLKLSQDEHLGNDPLITEFLKKYHEYQQSVSANSLGLVD